MEKQGLVVSVEDIEGIPVVRAAGQIDLATAPALSAVVDDLTARAPQALVFDLTRITHLDSSGIMILFHARRRLARHGGEVVVISDAHSVLMPLQLCGLDQRICVFRTEEELRRALN